MLNKVRIIYLENKYKISFDEKWEVLSVKNSDTLGIGYKIDKNYYFKHRNNIYKFIKKLTSSELVLDTLLVGSIVSLKFKVRDTSR